MGRVPKSEKLKSIIKTEPIDHQHSSSQSSEETSNKETKTMSIFKSLNSETSLYFTKEFKCWLNTHIDFSNLKIIILSIRRNFFNLI